MPVFWGNLVIIIILTVAVILAVRSIIRARKSGKYCGGDCSTCRGCPGKEQKLDQSSDR